MKAVNWREAPDAVEFKKMVPGGYVARIVGAEDVPEKEYLKIKYDINEGPLEGIYTEQFEKFGNWSGNFIRSYKEKALPFFKGFLTAVEESNSGYRFNDDENTLINKLVGVVIGQEEYLKQDGTIGVRNYVSQLRDIKAVRNGDFEIPKFRKLSSAADTSFYPAVNSGSIEDDLPF